MYNAKWDKFNKNPFTDMILKMNQFWQLINITEIKS